MPFISDISRIQYPLSFSAAVLSFISSKDRLSENHSPASFSTSIDLPTPGGPAITSTVSNLQPGSYILRTAAVRIRAVASRVKMLSSAPK